MNLNTRDDDKILNLNQYVYQASSKENIKLPLEKSDIKAAVL